MKKILFFGLSLLVIASCTKNIRVEKGQVPITLGAGVEALTKAPVANTDAITAGIAGWEAASEPDYSGAATWTTNITKDAGANTVTWNEGTKYYNSNGDKTYMKAWYPNGTFANDGSDDVLLASVNGSKSDANSKVLTFNHMTTQVSFKVISNGTLATGTKIERITLTDVCLPTGFSAAKEVTWATAAPLNAYSKTSGNGEEITTTLLPLESTVMFKPCETLPKLTIVTDKATYNNVSFNTTNAEGGADKLLAGSAYVITLTFGQVEIEVTATITAWKSETGSGNVI